MSAIPITLVELEAMKGNLVYLATPYSRYPDLERAFVMAAGIAARLMRHTGGPVYSPIVHCHPIAIHGGLNPLDHQIWLPTNEAMLIAADVLVVAHMDGWQESHGVAEEIKFFEQAGKPIFDLDPQTMMMTRRRRLKPVRERIDGLSEDVVDAEKREWLGHSGGKAP